MEKLDINYYFLVEIATRSSFFRILSLLYELSLRCLRIFGHSNTRHELKFRFTMVLEPTGRVELKEAIILYILFFDRYVSQINQKTRRTPMIIRAGSLWTVVENMLCRDNRNLVTERQKKCLKVCSLIFQSCPSSFYVYKHFFNVGIISQPRSRCSGSDIDAIVVLQELSVKAVTESCRTEPTFLTEVRLRRIAIFGTGFYNGNEMAHRQYLT